MSAILPWVGVVFAVLLLIVVPILFAVGAMLLNAEISRMEEQEPCPTCGRPVRGKPGPNCGDVHVFEDAWEREWGEDYYREA
jgi:predicted RNA-binding Zn-ribbon protein involved in translation (DUF1610 family)